MAPVVKALESHGPPLVSRVCVTGQHRQMLDQVLSLFGIVPDYDLNVMQDSQSPTQVAAAVLTRLEPVLLEERPDWVLVQGDTTTVAAAALAAFYAGAKVGHVEAGLRSYDKHQPFPEEINRRVAGVTADLHFSPTTRSRDNLLREGTPPDTVLVTGNPVIDALHMVAHLPYDPRGGPLEDLPAPRRLLVVTAHRRENLGPPLASICRAIRAIAEDYAGDVHVVFPVHLNPRVRDTVFSILSGMEGVTLTDPLDYLPLVYLLKRATLVLTDSGGIQEEAPGLGRPVLVLRDVTERPEAVDAGTVRLVGTDQGNIERAIRRLLDDADAYASMARAVNPYGDGCAAGRIVRALY